MWWFVSATPVRVGCFVPLPAAWGLVCAPVLVFLVRARGPPRGLGMRLWGFPAVVCAVIPVTIIASLCHMHGGVACLLQSVEEVSFHGQDTDWNVLQSGT